VIDVIWIGMTDSEKTRVWLFILGLLALSLPNESKDKTPPYPWHPTLIADRLEACPTGF